MHPPNTSGQLDSRPGSEILAAGAATLEVVDAVRRFGGRQALAGASLTLHRGELLALLGPNGAGKTTLIRAISGRLRLDSGQILVHGETLIAGKCRQQTAKMGVIPQNIALYEKLTARENLQLFGTLYGITGPKLTDRIDWALQWAGLVDRADEIVASYSGGMQRRLNIGCGVLHDPEIILLDEPTVGVDPQSRQRIRDMLKQLQQQGNSILLTTHQLDETQQVCNRIVIMDNGRTITSGTFEQLVRASVGTGRKVVLTVESHVASLPAGFTRRDDSSVVCEVTEIAAQLPELLGMASAAGLQVTDISVETPTLQTVFLHYTGHELREA